MFPIVYINIVPPQDKAFNLHFQETFFVSNRAKKLSIPIPPAFNLHFQETFFVSQSTKSVKCSAYGTFNLHFQETFFVSHLLLYKTLHNINHFQSPFSGDFLCFVAKATALGMAEFLSISIFRRLSLFQKSNGSLRGVRVCFQSPFSGDFLCFIYQSLLLLWVL